MEDDRLRAEGEFLFLFGLCRELLENRVLETTLVSLCSARENHEGGEYDVMVLATVQTYFLLFRGGILCRGLWSCMFIFAYDVFFFLCENQSSLVLTYNAPWYVMTDLFASSRFICGFGGGGVFILCPGLN